MVPKGLGTALKPAHEPICVARKPLVGTVAANVLEFGTGAINIDECRVGVDSGNFGIKKMSAGRWPANVVHDGSAEVLTVFPDAPGQQGKVTGFEPTANGFSGAVKFSGMLGRIESAEPRVEAERSAARFFYCAKPSASERHAGHDQPGPMLAHGSTLRDAENLGADRAGNSHPTVKPLALMRHLCKLITPAGGIVLDPFMGSGTTGMAAVLDGFQFIGIEQAPEYIDIAHARIEWAHKQASQQPPESPQQDLFAEVAA